MDALLWVDIETTGLDPNTDYLLEIAWQFTTLGGAALGDVRHHISAYWPRHDSVAYPWPQVVVDMHVASGLLDDIYNPEVPKAPMAQAIRSALRNDIASAKIGDGVETIYLAGSSVHFDRSFIERKMPGALDGVSHRHFDVSTLKILWQMSTGEKFTSRAPHQPEHRAVNDIKNSQEDAFDILAYVTERF